MNIRHVFHGYYAALLWILNACQDESLNHVSGMWGHVVSYV